ncbi:hypothetical protein BD413DRAFT_492776 [Trametes elegans]|nr:hypothetical protein BD413DRAFT_492776 [Trametes elegans]
MGDTTLFVIDDHNRNSIVYETQDLWFPQENVQYAFENTLTAGLAGAKAALTFSGSAVVIWGIATTVPGALPPAVQFSIDGNVVQTTTAPNNGTRDFEYAFLDIESISDGKHLLEFNVLNATKQYPFALDLIAYLPSSGASPTASQQIVTSFIPAPTASSTAAATQSNSSSTPVGAIVGGVVGGVAVLVAAAIAVYFLFFRRRSNGQPYFYASPAKAGDLLDQEGKPTPYDIPSPGAGAATAPHLPYDAARPTSGGPSAYSGTTAFSAPAPPPPTSAYNPSGEPVSDYSAGTSHSGPSQQRSSFYVANSGPPVVSSPNQPRSKAAEAGLLSVPQAATYHADSGIRFNAAGEPSSPTAGGSGAHHTDVLAAPELADGAAHWDSDLLVNADCITTMVAQAATGLGEGYLGDGVYRADVPRALVARSVASSCTQSSVQVDSVLGGAGPMHGSERLGEALAAKDMSHKRDCRPLMAAAPMLSSSRIPFKAPPWLWNSRSDTSAHASIVLGPRGKLLRPTAEYQGEEAAAAPTASAMPDVNVDSANTTAIEYDSYGSASWELIQTGNNAGVFSQTLSRVQSTAGIVFRFHGTRVQVYGTLTPPTTPGATVTSSYTIDSAQSGSFTSSTVPNSATTELDGHLFYDSDTLPDGAHTLVINVTLASAAEPYLLDYIKYAATDPGASTGTSSSPSGAATGSSAGSGSGSHSNVGPIVGGVVGGVLGAALLVSIALFVFFRYFRHRVALSGRRAGGRELVEDLVENGHGGADAGPSASAPLMSETSESGFRSGSGLGSSSGAGSGAGGAGSGAGGGGSAAPWHGGHLSQSAPSTVGPDDSASQVAGRLYAAELGRTGGGGGASREGGSSAGPSSYARSRGDRKGARAVPEEPGEEEEEEAVQHQDSGIRFRGGELPPAAGAGAGPDDAERPPEYSPSS